MLKSLSWTFSQNKLDENFEWYLPAENSKAYKKLDEYVAGDEQVMLALDGLSC